MFSFFWAFLYWWKIMTFSIAHFHYWHEPNFCAASTVNRRWWGKMVFLVEVKRDIFRSRKVHKKMDLPHQSPCLIWHKTGRKNSIYGTLLNPFLLTFSFIIPFFLITLNGQMQRHVSNAHAINEPTKSCRHCQVAYFSIRTKRPKSSWKLPKMSRFNEQSN